MQPSDLVSIYSELLEIVGEENTFKIFEHFRGQSATFPQRIYSTQYVAQYVKENFDGKNLHEIARKFNYSERQIRQFLKMKN